MEDEVPLLTVLEDVKNWPPGGVEEPVPVDDCPPGGVEEPVPVDDWPPGGVEPVPVDDPPGGVEERVPVEDCPPGGVEDPAGGPLLVDEVVEAEEGIVVLLPMLTDEVTNWPPGGPVVEEPKVSTELEEDINGMMELEDDINGMTELEEDPNVVAVLLGPLGVAVEERRPVEE